MLSVSDADQILAEHGLSLSTETVPFAEARGLAETILADRNFPSHNALT